MNDCQYCGSSVGCWVHEADDSTRVHSSVPPMGKDTPDELRILRSLALAFIEGINRLPLDGVTAFDPVEEILNEWITDHGRNLPASQELMGTHQKLVTHNLPTNRQQRRAATRAPRA